MLLLSNSLAGLQYFFEGSTAFFYWVLKRECEIDAECSPPTILECPAILLSAGY